MFTGIIKELGKVKSFGSSGGAYRLVVESRKIYDTVTTGDSISINGVCLTVVGKNDHLISFDVTEETARKTTTAKLKSGMSINMEESLRADGLVGGHFVLGHVDCVGKIKWVGDSSKEFFIEIEFPESFDNLIVEKGSVAIDGVSLTVGEVGRGSFKTYLIPHTLKETTVGFKKRGDEVNLEFDIIGKYAVKFSTRDYRITEGFLRSKGF